MLRLRDHTAELEKYAEEALPIRCHGKFCSFKCAALTF
jgi:hypothetical protein